MIDRIGAAAGSIWHYLDKQSEPVSLSNIRENLSISSTLVMMAIGWLAREDKINIDISDGSYSYKIALKR